MAGGGGNKKRYLARLWFPLLCCLAIVLPAPRFPSSRPDTASFRSCLSLRPGFLGTREAGICAGSRVCFLLLFLLDVSVPVDVCKVIQAAIEQILVKRR